MNSNNNEELLSKTILSLRFPLIVGVVLVHAYPLITSIRGNSYASEIEIPLIYNYVRILFSKIICQICVPLFFFISGFLFFYKSTWGLSVYKKKIKKRLRTLLIPYLFWNLVALFYFWIITQPFMRFCFPNGAEVKYVTPWIMNFWIASSSGTEVTAPILGQFWFLRDLMIFVLLTPLMYYLVYRFRIYTLFVIVITWVFNIIPGLPHLSCGGLLFFSLGAYFSIHKKDFILVFSRISLFSFIAYPILATIDLLSIGTLYNTYIHDIGILMGVIFAINFVVLLLNKGIINMKLSQILASTSFFIYAFHEPVLLSYLRKLLYVIFKPTTNSMLIFLYFFSVIIVVILCCSILFLIRKMFPRFTSLITGGR